MGNGLFIVIDGSDGSGKTTQHTRLKERLQAEGIPFETVDFPQYHHPSAYFVEQYLSGQYGTVDEVPPKQASLFYAMDRFAATRHIRSAVTSGKVVIANRFTASNMGHQGAKIKDAAKRRELYAWLEQLEHGILAIPKPDLNIILTISAQRAQHNITTRALARDIHEQDPDFLKRSAEVYAELPQLFPDYFIAIDCMKDQVEMRAVEEIHQEIWKQVQRRLGVKAVE